MSRALPALQVGFLLFPEHRLLAVQGGHGLTAKP